MKMLKNQKIKIRNIKSLKKLENEIKMKWNKKKKELKNKLNRRRIVLKN